MRAWLCGNHENLGLAKDAIGSVIGAAGVFGAFFAFGNSATFSMSLAVEAGAAFLAMDLCQILINTLVKKAKSCSERFLVQESLSSIIRIGSQEILILSSIQAAKYFLREYEGKSVPEIFDDTQFFLTLMSGPLCVRELSRILILLNARRLMWDLSSLTPKQNLFCVLFPFSLEAITFIVESFPQNELTGEMGVAFVTGSTLKFALMLLMKKYCFIGELNQSYAPLAVRSVSQTYNTQILVGSEISAEVTSDTGSQASVQSGYGNL